jgi:hypothetical protein
MGIERIEAPVNEIIGGSWLPAPVNEERKKQVIDCGSHKVGYRYSPH